MPALDAEAFVPRRIAGGTQHVVDARTGIRLEQENGSTAVGDEVLAWLGKQAAHMDSRVLRALILGQVVAGERERIGHLPALQVDHTKASPGRNADRPSLPRGDFDRFGGPHGTTLSHRAAPANHPSPQRRAVDSPTACPE